MTGYKTYLVVVIAIFIQILFRMDYIYKADRDDLMMMLAAAATATVAHKMNRMMSNQQSIESDLVSTNLITGVNTMTDKKDHRLTPHESEINDKVTKIGNMRKRFESSLSIAADDLRSANAVSPAAVEAAITRFETMQDQWLDMNMQDKHDS